MQAPLAWTLIAYHFPFLVSTQVSDYQLGLVIKHRIPVAFYSCKLTQLHRILSPWRKNFFPLLKPLQCFTLCCLAAMYFSLQPYFPYSSYPPGSCTGASLSLEEYQVHFHSIQGSSNTLAVALTRLPAREGQTMDSIFDPSLCSPQEHMSGFNTMTKLTYMITQQLQSIMTSYYNA